MKSEVMLMAFWLISIVAQRVVRGYDLWSTMRTWDRMDNWMANDDYSSCSVKQEGPLELFFLCRDINTVSDFDDWYDECKMKIYKDRKFADPIVHPYNASFEGPCVPFNTYSISKPEMESLKGFRHLMNGSLDSACAFNDVRTLDISNSGLGQLDLLGGQRCIDDQCKYQLKSLFLTGNEIKTLEKGSFCRFKGLETLFMNYTALYEVHEEAFVHLTSLTFLNLEDNDLTHLPISLFQSNTKLEYLLLSKNKLTSQVLPVLRPLFELHFLNLDDNLIDSIDYESSIFKNTHGLNELYVRNNRIKNISSALISLNESTTLNVRNNSISHFVWNAFHHLKSILIIDLSDNPLRTLNNETFARNLKLEELVLENNQLTEFPPFNYLINLKKLILVNNRLKSIIKLDLISLTKLELLNLSNNQIAIIERGSFDTIVRLEVLDLSRNMLQNFQFLTQTTNMQKLNLDYNEVSRFSFYDCPNELKSLSIRHNRIEKTDFTVFDNGEWKLTRLFLSYNRIRTFPHANLPYTVEELDLEGNRLNRLSFYLYFIKSPNLSRLRELNLKNNNISVACDNNFMALHETPAYVNNIHFHLTGNPLACSCDNHWMKKPSHPNYTISDFDDLTCRLPSGGQEVRLSKAEDDLFLCRSDHLNSRRCLCSYTHHCRLTTPAPCVAFSNYQFTMIRYDCWNRNLTIVPGFLFDIPYADPDVDVTSVTKEISAMIDLTGNDLGTVKRWDFPLFNFSLVNLTLASSKISSIEQNAFQELVNLTHLCLQNNLLRKVPELIFKPLISLQVLDLSGNLLNFLFNGTFLNLQSLIILNLHSNRFKRLPVDRIRQLGSLRALTLYDNPWTCECAFVETFRDYLSNFTHIVFAPNSLFCEDKEKALNILRFDMSLCRTLLNVTALSTSLSFAVVLIVLTILVFVFRLEMQVLVYSRLGLRMFHRRQPEEEVQGKQYDAFIAYNSKDEDFMVNELMPGLESIEKPYRLCIHERDFPAGSYIQDSILDAISMSSRTIVILSENFVQSGWCRYEFKSAHMQMLEDRCPRILVIVLGEVPEQLDPEMQLYLRTNTYLMWGERLFWQKLYYAMPDLRVTSPPTEIMPMRDF